ncbi:MAG TPA: molybdopterin molybdotransferase MoeA [Candidatus Ozemobacteraceae bacterium]|nr:molybdopterin molybdotransferase MoeA [Candidatus Ozemobacteraceae bacterium]
MPTLPLHTFETTRDLIMAAAATHAMPPESIPLDQALGRILAADLSASEDLPMADNSAMDGYCLRHADAAGARPDAPVTLPLVAGIDAGHPLETLPEGHAAYIATGGMIPAGADVVLKIEDATLTPDTGNLVVKSLPPVGTFIRRRGRDRRRGDLVLSRGEPLTPFALGVAASLGRMAVEVARRPRVCILTSGDEVVMPFETPKPWQVRNSNATILQAFVRSAGGEPLDLGIVRDDPEAAIAALGEAARLGDVIVTSGGISMGRCDPFVTALERMNAPLDVRGVLMKPGKPLTFGRIHGKPYFGLPGNQASSAVTAELFLRPFLARLCGSLRPDHRLAMLPLTRELQNRTGRDDFLRARLVSTATGPAAEPLGHQDSHLLSSLLGADLLARHPVDRPLLAAGDLVECRFIG